MPRPLHHESVFISSCNYHKAVNYLYNYATVCLVFIASPLF